MSIFVRSRKWCLEENDMAAIKALLVSCAISAVWYALEFEQFGELQWNRKCDGIVWWLYFFALWYLFAHQK